MVLQGVHGSEKASHSSPKVDQPTTPVRAPARGKAASPTRAGKHVAPAGDRVVAAAPQPKKGLFSWLSGSTAQPAAPKTGGVRSTGSSARTPKAPTFGGVTIRGVNDWYTNARGTVFGGKSDPKDSGVGSFGYKTGPGGREGVAIPQRVMAALTGTNDKSVHQQYRVEVLNRATGKRATFDIVDRGPAERTWRAERRPVVDLTEGAVKTMGGTLAKDRRGRTVSAEGLESLSFRIIKK